MQVTNALKICADSSFKQAVTVMGRIDTLAEAIDKTREAVRGGALTKLRGDERIAGLKADVEDAVAEFDGWVAERVERPRETFAKVYALDPMGVDPKVVAVAPHFDWTREELSELLSGYLAGDDYSTFRFVASCARDRGMSVSDPKGAAREAMETVLDMIAGYCRGIVSDAAAFGPHPSTAYRGNTAGLMSKVLDAIDGYEQTAISFAIEGGEQ